MEADTPPLQGISHIALSARDLPAARTFWTDVMGFEVATDTPALLFVIHRPSRIAIAVTNHGGEVHDGFDERRTGLDHLAFAVEDSRVLHAWQHRLAEQGVVHSPVTDSGSGLHLNLRAPDDIPIELYVMDHATATAFGLPDTREAFAGSFTYNV